LKQDTIHARATVVDSLIVSDWSDDVFNDIRLGGITACNATCAVWENFRETSENIARIYQFIERHPDMLTLVRKTGDVKKAKEEGKVGIILGFQNTSPLENRIDFIRLFKALGVGVMQLTYNNQNLLGSGAFETHDSGLSDFGREAIDEFNAAGVAIDLSHVGIKTTADVIAYSSRPVCFTHANPRALRDHVRNKSDETLRALADAHGYVGTVLSPVFMPDGANEKIEDVVVALDYLINLVGEDQVGIGTDMTQGHGEDFWRWIMRINGTGSQVEFTPKDKQGMVIRKASDWPLITAALERHGYTASRIEKIIGKNFVDYLGRAWNETA
jgi:membrane dipeptidase